jgi:uncharacterized protein (DUF927 family)
MHEIFETNPGLKKCYITSDGTPFYQENDAKNHAKTLKDKTVEPVFNEKELQVVDAEELTEAEKEMAAFEAEEREKEAKAQEQSEKEAAEQKAADDKAELAKALAEFDPETAEYAAAIKLFKGLGLVAETNKKEDIYPVLVAAKAKAQEENNPQV